MNVQGKEISVFGLGKTGKSVISFLLEKGARVLATDNKSEEQLRGVIKELKELSARSGGGGVTFELGGHPDHVIVGKDLIVVSPGVKSHLPIIQKAKQQGVPVISEIELASLFCPCPIVAVTGTNGKSTTTSLIGHILRERGKKAVVAGNIGFPFIEALSSLSEDSFAVIEVSSFQLQEISTFAPHIGILLNITEDHLNWHSSFEEYVRAKEKLFANQKEGDLAILNLDDPLVNQIAFRTFREGVDRSVCQFTLTEAFLDAWSWIEQSWPGMTQKTGGNASFFMASRNGDQIQMVAAKESGSSTLTMLYSLSSLPLKGSHNIQNFMASAAACYFLGLPPPFDREVRTFASLHHRLEFVGSVRGVSFYDDSKATNPDATLKALQSLHEPVILVAGGSEKNLDLSPLRFSKIKGVVLLGQTREKLVDVFSFLPKGTLHLADNMNEAVRRAFSMAKPGETVLLSPACASLDMFRDAEERGEQFQEAVKRIKDEESQAS